MVANLHPIMLCGNIIDGFHSRRCTWKYCPPRDGNLSWPFCTKRCKCWGSNVKPGVSEIIIYRSGCNLLLAWSFYTRRPNHLSPELALYITSGNIWKCVTLCLDRIIHSDTYVSWYDVCRNSSSTIVSNIHNPIYKSLSFAKQLAW